jgi:hypothetical protein
MMSLSFGSGFPLMPMELCLCGLFLFPFGIHEPVFKVPTTVLPTGLGKFLSFGYRFCTSAQDPIFNAT